MHFSDAFGKNHVFPLTGGVACVLSIDQPSLLQSLVPPDPADWPSVLSDAVGTDFGSRCQPQLNSDNFISYLF